MIYFDNGATTPLYPEVVESMKQVLGNYYGNPSSLHHLGVQADKLLEQSRELAAKFLGVNPGEVIFTSGATESNNTAIKGVAFQYGKRGKHIITSAIEHSAVYDTCIQLRDHFGYELTILPVDKDGMVRIEDLKNAVREDTILVSIMYINNEVGSIQPIAEIGKVLRDYPKILFHVDAVQAFGKIPVEPSKVGVDLLSLSAHKFHGPKGIGLLYVRKGIKLLPLMAGGGQEGNYRSGTENLAGIVGMVKAMRITLEKLNHQSNELSQARKVLWNGLQQLEGCYLNTPEQGSPHILNFSLPGLKSEVVLHALEDEGIYVSTKSACSSKSGLPSRVLSAMGLDDERAKSSIRVSLSYLNTLDEARQFNETITKLVPQIKKMLNVK
ncbi:MAG TPA: cysteine desulfurase family protein [Bacillota bacterium]|nr:cysteine desulfurase family protein [Bacillota bacterium]